jgi:hypothetical protein
MRPIQRDPFAQMEQQDIMCALSRMVEGKYVLLRLATASEKLRSFRAYIVQEDMAWLVPARRCSPKAAARGLSIKYSPPTF